MRIVVDANIVTALAIPLPYSAEASQIMEQWKHENVEIYAPVLLDYEVSSALRKAVALSILLPGDVRNTLEKINQLNIHKVPPTIELQRKAVDWATRLGQFVAYDAHYLAVAEQMDTDLWTADKNLAMASRDAGISWVWWIREKAE